MKELLSEVYLRLKSAASPEIKKPQVVQQIDFLLFDPVSQLQNEAIWASTHNYQLLLCA